MKKLLSAFILSLLGTFAYAGYSPILPVYVRILGGGGLQVGGLSSSFMLARAVSASIFGRLSDVLDQRVSFIRIGIFLFILTALLFLYADSYPWILGLVAFQGVISGMVWPQIQTLIARGAERDYRSRAFSLYFISGNTGMLLSSGAVGAGLSILARRGIGEPLSYRYIFAGVVIFYLLTLFFSFRLQEFKAGVIEPQKRREAELPFPLLLGMVVGNGMAQGLFGSLLLLYLYDRFQLSSRDIAYALFLAQIGGLLFTYLISHISDVKGEGWGMFLTQLPLAVFCLLLPWLRSPSGVILAMPLLVFGIKGFIPISRSLVSESKSGVGTRIGLVNTVSNLGAVIGPLVGGAIYEMAGVERPLLALAIFPVLGAGVGVLSLYSFFRGKRGRVLT